MTQTTVLSTDVHDDVSDRETFADLAVMGSKIYYERLKLFLEPEQNGKTVAIHLESGDYTVARNSPEAMHDLHRKHPNGIIMTQIIGPSQPDSVDDRIGRALGQPRKTK